MKSVKDFSIQFHTQLVKNNLITTDFKIVYQTENKMIEKYCMENYPDLMVYSQYTIEQLKRLQYMKSYIKKNLLKTDIQTIENYFYEKHWFDPYKISDGITNIKLINYDCKTWTEPDIPYLEIEGEVTMDLKKMLILCFNKNYVQYIKQKSRVLSESLSFKFIRPFPMYMTFRGGQEAKREILSMITKNVNNIVIGDKIRPRVESLLKIKDIHKYKKTLSWKYQDEILLEINDAVGLLKKTAKDNIIPLTAGYFLYKDLKRRR